MSFFTLAGTEYGVETVQELEPERIGAEEPSFDGTATDTYRAEKRRWQMTLTEMSEATFATLRATVKNAAHVTVDGDIVNNSPLLCQVKLGPADYVQDSGGIKRKPQLQIREV